MKLDNKFTEKISAYLSQEADERDVTQGALILFQLNHNRILFNNVIRRPQKFAKKVEYELNKFLKIRLDSKTKSDVIEMVNTVIPQAEKSIKEEYTVIKTDDDLPGAKIAKGKRSDHDDLPDEIKKLWDESSALYPKIKSTFEQLKTMEKSPACDRYEYLRLLDKLDSTYRKNLEIYDNFNAENLSSANDNKEDNIDAGELSKKISAARTYITSNKKKLSELIKAENPDNDKIISLKNKIIERVQFLSDNNSPIDNDNINELKVLGIEL